MSEQWFPLGGIEWKWTWGNLLGYWKCFFFLSWSVNHLVISQVYPYGTIYCMIYLNKDVFLKIFLKKSPGQCGHLVEHCPVHQKAASLIPSQGIFPGFGFGPQLGCWQEATHNHVSFSPFRFLSVKSLKSI